RSPWPSSRSAASRPRTLPSSIPRARSAGGSGGSRSSCTGATPCRSCPSKRLGVTGVVDAAGDLIGVVTDGDLRRGLEEAADVRALTARDLMTRFRRPDRRGEGPKTIAADALAAEAVAVMERHQITSLFILADGTQRPIGVIHLHDLLRAGVVYPWRRRGGARSGGGCAAGR